MMSKWRPTWTEPPKTGGMTIAWAMALTESQNRCKCGKGVTLAVTEIYFPISYGLGLNIEKIVLEKYDQIFLYT